MDKDKKIKKLKEENKRLKQIIDAMDIDKRKYKVRASEIEEEIKQHEKLKDKYEN